MSNPIGKFNGYWEKQITSSNDLIEMAKYWKIPNFKVLNKEILDAHFKQKEFNYILNLDARNGNGTHWVALKKKNGEIAYIDSYGFPPPERLHKQLEALKKDNHVMYLDHQIQPDDSQRCGFYCLLALRDPIKNLLEFDPVHSPNSNNDRKLRKMLMKVQTRGTHGGMVDYLINNLPFEAHLVSNPAGKRSWNLNKMNFAGPGTKLVPSDPRLKSPDQARTSGPPHYKIKPWSQPINALDEAAYYHDIAYDKFKTRDRRKAADRKLMTEAQKIGKDSSETYVNRGVAKVVAAIMKRMSS